MGDHLQILKLEDFHLYHGRMQTAQQRNPVRKSSNYLKVKNIKSDHRCHNMPLVEEKADITAKRHLMPVLIQELAIDWNWTKTTYSIL